MQRVGTNYGGWYIPKDIKLNSESIIYSGGVGEDISFDLLLSKKYNSTIYLIDPTRKSIIHYNEIKEYYETKIWKISGNIQKDYKNLIENIQININKIKYINKGLWDKKDKLKFYKQDNSQYVSQSLIDNMFGNQYDEVEVDTIKNIMRINGHNKIDLLKLDIEGAEIKVLNNMLDDKIYPTYLCIEFDLFLKNKDILNETQSLIKRLQEIGYKILFNDNMNITFLLN